MFSFFHFVANFWVRGGGVVRWNTVEGTRGFYAGAISCLVNPILLICINSKLKAKVVVMFEHIVCSKK